MRFSLFCNINGKDIIN